MLCIALCAAVVWEVTQYAAETADEHHAEETLQTLREARQEEQNTAETAPQSAFPESLRQKNPELAAWLAIPDTVIDYPVMWTPDEPEKYLYRDFYGGHSLSGTPFADTGDASPASADCMIVHGHNMRDKGMFSTLLYYEDEDYWRAHPAVTLALPQETREYEVFAVFRLRADSEKDSRLYGYAGTLTDSRWNGLLAECWARAEYDTGVSAVPGDKLLLLSTCSYNAKDERFVVAARCRAEQE